MMDCMVYIYSSFSALFSPEKSLETPFLPTLLAVSSVRLVIDQRVMKSKG